MQSKHFFFLLVCLSCRSVEWTKSSWAEPKTRLTRRWSATPAARSVNRLPRLFMTRQTRKHVKISHFKLKFNQTHFGCHQVPPSPPQRPISMKKQTQRFTNEKERQRHRFRCCTQRQSDLICITFVSAVAECSARWATRRPAATQKWWRQLRCKSFLLNYFNLQLFKFLKNLAPHRQFFFFFWKFKFGAKSINRVLIKIEKGFFFFFFWKMIHSLDCLGFGSISARVSSSVWFRREISTLPVALSPPMRCKSAARRRALVIFNFLSSLSPWNMRHPNGTQ